MDPANNPATMPALTADDTSAPVDVEGIRLQRNGKAESVTTTDLTDPTDLSVQEFLVATNYPKNLTLDVGGRKFKVSRDTLKAESGLFERQLSGRFSPWEPEADGSYFLDADPDLFEHLLRFMRRPEVFPLFYSKMNGFDYDLYNRLQAEALYFQMDTLYNWIKFEGYLAAIKVKASKMDVRRIGNRNMVTVPSEALPVNIIQDLHVIPRTRKIYLCPRQIIVHKGRPELCGAACHKSQGEREVQYEVEESLEVVTVEKEIVFDGNVCRVD
ncbi:hypothetical protein ACET3X_002676 [Alternaria dauci]|uniref:BTB domain-containing protein n=1 Tax=Alternaria dauci TaxID=48095 RepID=A0ABR3UQN3_9PLEO